MVWILVLAGLAAAAVFGAHRLLGLVDAFGPAGQVRAVPRGLVYAAAVVAAGQATDAAIAIDQVSGAPLGLSAGDNTQLVVQVLATHAADIAWQAGLLLAAAALVASVTAAGAGAARG